MASHSEEVLREELLAHSCPNGHLSGAGGCDFCGCDDCWFGCRHCKKRVNPNLASFLQEAGVEKYDIVGHYRMLTDTIQIFVEKMDGDRLALDVGKDEWIDEVKGKLEVIVWVPPDRQRLIFAGEVLEDSERLSHYNIAQDDTLTLVVVNMEQDPSLSEEPAQG